MKNLFLLLVVGAIGIAATFRETPTNIKIIGAWKLLRAQYGDGVMKDQELDSRASKMFTSTRWSTAFYNLKTKTFDGAAGGSYTLNGNEYVEEVDYFSWDAEVAGKKITFSLTIENGLLHQVGTIEYKGNPKYMINEWYQRID